jgi:hypothetical protein
MATDSKSCIHLKREHFSADIHSSHVLTYIIFVVHTIACVSQSSGMKWKGHVACLGKKKNCMLVSVVKPEGNRPLGR